MIVKLVNVELLDRVILLLTLLLLGLHVDLSSLLAEVAGRPGLVASALDDGLEDACSRQVQIWYVRQLLAILVRTVLQDLDTSDHGREQFDFVGEVDAIHVRSEPEGASQVVRLCFTVD